MTLIVGKRAKKDKRKGQLRTVHRVDVKKCSDCALLYFLTPALMQGWRWWWHSLRRRPADQGKSLLTAHERHPENTVCKEE